MTPTNSTNRFIPIPPATWTRRFDQLPPRRAHPLGLSLFTLLHFTPTVIRMQRETWSERKLGHAAVLDMMHSARTTPMMGVPLGGLGGGSIGRGWRGDFNRWQMCPGMVEYRNVLADQFSLWAQRGDQPAQALVLNPVRPKGRQLNSWAWGMPPEKGTYHALFPRAWTVYEEPLPGIRLTCRQVSPVIPHNYQESSYPVGVFVWSVENTGASEADVALMFTFQNGTGAPNDRAGGHGNSVTSVPINHDQEVVAIELRHSHRQARLKVSSPKNILPEAFEDPLTFAIAIQTGPGVEASYRARFDPLGNGKELWDDFTSDGRLDNQHDPTPSQPGECLAGALCVHLQVPAGELRQVSFALAWDMPIARFGWGTAWRRRYTHFFGHQGEASTQIARAALLNYPDWEAQIDAWQALVLDDPGLPDWYKSALFNESYYLVDGGTIWTAGREEHPDSLDELLPEPEIGHFAYLEGHEYRMYNTYDVHFSASFALAMLWPQLEISLQSDFIHSLAVSHPDQHAMWSTGVKAPRKAPGVIAHDLGSPLADPWRQLNAYLNQDVSRWKDLNAKFILQIYRDFLITHDQDFLESAFPYAVQALESLAGYDRDGDGLIENEGYPDQTYDTWTMQGSSAYCGGLWLASLGAMAGMAEALGKQERATEFHSWQEKGKKAFQEKLWNGEYYNFDCSPGERHKTIMADQLAGHWFGQACGLAGIVPAENARSAYRKIYQTNVLGVGGGEFGAMNGMRPDGAVDHSTLQSKEMWPGTVYALSAGMLLEGLVEEAFATARGAYLASYRDYGLWFQTPEALQTDGTYRALGYMRPLAIWAIQWAWEKRMH